MNLLLVCTSGGHFATMRNLRSFWSEHHRIWVTDYQKDTESLTKDEEVFWLPYQAPRDLITLITNIPSVFFILHKEKPDLVIATGASISIGFALGAKLLHIPYIYIESISRSQDLSLTGKIVYPFCDTFYVQWPQLTRKYPQAVYEGIV